MVKYLLHLCIWQMLMNWSECKLFLLYFKYIFLSACVFPWNQTRDICVANAMLNQLSYKNTNRHIALNRAIVTSNYILSSLHFRSVFCYQSHQESVMLITDIMLLKPKTTILKTHRKFLLKQIFEILLQVLKLNYIILL